MTIDLASLKVKDELNDDIWTEDRQLKPEIRKHLTKIALDFFEGLDIPWANLEDITFTGSLANYNWSKYSDIDLHLVVDFTLVDDNVDLVDAFFNARKNLWNNRHDIEIHGFDVEVYVQDANEPHYATGVYSIMNDRWLVEPKPQKPFINKDAIGRKAKFIMRLIDEVAKIMKRGEYQEAIDEAEKLSDKIKKMRSCGLEKGGEYSVENLTFKILRRNGYMGKLYDVKLDAYDKMMTIK